MNLEEVKSKQRRYIEKRGGYANLKESDETSNDFNRALIRAFKEAYGTAVIGKINLPLKNPCTMDPKEPTVYEEYTGQTIYNFEADFVIPYMDEALKALILEWNTKEGYQKGMGLLGSIMNRIESCGGLRLVWN